MLEVGKIVRIMKNTSLGMDADFHNEIVYSSSPKYFQQARRYRIQVSAEILCSLKYSRFTAEAANVSKCKSTQRTSASTDFPRRLTQFLFKF